MIKILIVDDDSTLLQTLSHAFQQEGYAVVTLADGALALETIRRECPNLVILEIMLPGLDGLTVCRLIRQDPQIAEIAIIMLSERSTVGDKMVGLDNGADDYVTKPFVLGELLSRVRAALRRVPGHAISSRKLAAGDVRVDLLAHKAYHGTDMLQLSIKEFDLLAELMHNKGAVLTRDFILSRVWGSDFTGGVRTVDVHVCWLREKIEDDPANPKHIASVRGVGYRFEG